VASERPENPERSEKTPREGFPLETPSYEEQIDPYFQDKIETESQENRINPPDAEEDWYWREPENFWQDEDMWPWPEPAPRSKRSKPETP